MYAITIADDEWERLDDHGPSRLRAGLLVNGVSLHLEAWPVCANESRGYRVQEYIGPHPEAFRALEVIDNAAGTYATLAIGGQSYVLVAFPHSE
jgi:hypothetical protein